MVRLQSQAPAAAARLGRGVSGQATAETVIALAFVLSFMLALVHLALLASTRHFVNYAAFAGARVSMYGTTDWRVLAQAGRDQRAARDVVDILDWGWRPQSGATDQGYRVEYPTPFAFPLFHHAGNVVVVTGIAPIAKQPDIPEEGDNAER